MKHIGRGIATLGICGLASVMAWVKMEGLAWLIPFVGLFVIWGDAELEDKNEK